MEPIILWTTSDFNSPEALCKAARALLPAPFLENEQYQEWDRQARIFYAQTNKLWNIRHTLSSCWCPERTADWFDTVVQCADTPMLTFFGHIPGAWYFHASWRLPMTPSDQHQTLARIVSVLGLNRKLPKESVASWLHYDTRRQKEDLL